MFCCLVFHEHVAAHADLSRELNYASASQWWRLVTIKIFKGAFPARRHDISGIFVAKNSAMMRKVLNTVKRKGVHAWRKKLHSVKECNNVHAHPSASRDVRMRCHAIA